MNTQHTPGPWDTSRDAVPDGIVQITVCGTDGKRVATVFGCEANARLIAAAPEMLATLLTFVRLCPSAEGLDGWAPKNAFQIVLHQARNAIDKAGLE